MSSSSVSESNAATTAALVWSILPELSPRGVRQLLLDACRPIPGKEGARSLTMQDALALARERVVERTVREEPVSLQSLSALTGLDVAVLETTLKSLAKSNKVFKNASGRFARYQRLVTS